MNSIAIAILGFIALLLGYKFYGSFIERLWDVDPSRETPAHSNYDGVDYIPAKHWSVLFGHHFAGIAGAGPIIGPVIAAAIWGWVPSLIWIILGSIFIGAVHDFSSLMVSVRSEGKSIAFVAEDVMGKRARLLFAAFIWLALVLVVAVFAAATANTLVKQPKIVVPTFGLILDAVLVGLMIYKWKLNQGLSTILGLLILIGLLFLGINFPVSFGSVNFWITLLLVYSFIASILPVNILLQPRDYLSTFILFAGLILGYAGIFLSRPEVTTPAFISFNSSKGPLWPMLGVFIACGAVSGFHSMIASGTTAKQLGNERDARKIGYGAMILEGLLAILALLAVTAGLAWKTGIHGLPVYPELLKSGDWIGTFAAGFGQLVKPILGSKLGALLAMITLNAFVMTTLDSATRITRYITEELFADSLKINIFRNRYFSTFFVVLSAGYLAFGNWKAVWPVFGASNQLVAALALIVVTIYLFTKKKPTAYTLYPGIFMLITSLTALVLQLIDFFIQKKYLLTSISLILILLTFFLVIECFKKLRTIVIFNHRNTEVTEKNP